MWGGSRAAVPLGLDGVMTTSPAVRVDISDAVATITLDRPEALNSLTTEAKAGLLDALREIGRAHV